MLQYVSSGERRYDLNPVPAHRRDGWEFEAVLEGEIGPTLDGSDAPLYASSTLWVFPPQTAHGWHGRTQAPAEIVVVHVSPVPEPVRSLALARGFLQTKLGAEEKAELVRVASLLGRELARPTDLGVLLTERALLDLFLMSIRDEPAKPLPHGGSRERQIVEAAVAYFSEHIAEGPSLERVARAVHVSSSHLRRIFQRVRKISPRQAFNTLRLKRATELLRDERLSLEEVATLCGFSDASAFSRAFRRMHGKPPSEWRRGRG